MPVEESYLSIYRKISFGEYEEAADPTWSYFPVIVKTGEKDEEGKPIELVSYAKHKYIYGDEMKEALENGHCDGEDL